MQNCRCFCAIFPISIQLVIDSNENNKKTVSFSISLLFFCSFYRIVDALSLIAVENGNGGRDLIRLLIFFMYMQRAQCTNLYRFYRCHSNCQMKFYCSKLPKVLRTLLSPCCTMYTQMHFSWCVFFFRIFFLLTQVHLIRVFAICLQFAIFSSRFVSTRLNFSIDSFEANTKHIGFMVFRLNCCVFACIKHRITIVSICMQSNKNSKKLHLIEMMAKRGEKKTELYLDFIDSNRQRKSAQKRAI